MGIFRRNGKETNTSEVAAAEWGRRQCPNCGGPGVVDFIDLVDQVTQNHCGWCWHRWTAARIAAVPTQS